jgi:hypothetical protein
MFCKSVSYLVSLPLSPFTEKPQVSKLEVGGGGGGGGLEGAY